AQTELRELVAMRSLTIFFIVLSVLALVVFSVPISAQNQQYPFPGYPSQFAPSRTSRPRPPEAPRLQTKFNKITNSVPNQDHLVLKDEAVTRLHRKHGWQPTEPGTMFVS